MLFQQGYLVCLKRKDTIQSHAIWTIETNYTKNQHLCRKEMAFFLLCISLSMWYKIWLYQFCCHWGHIVRNSETLVTSNKYILTFKLYQKVLSLYNLLVTKLK